MADSTDVLSLKQSRSNIIAVVAAKTEAWVASGCPPTYSIDGASYQWDDWLKTKMDEVDKLTQMIQKLSQPWIIRSRGAATG